MGKFDVTITKPRRVERRAVEAETALNAALLVLTENGLRYIDTVFTVSASAPPERQVSSLFRHGAPSVQEHSDIIRAVGGTVDNDYYGNQEHSVIMDAILNH